MKYLKRFNESNEQSIDDICRRYNIREYTINDDGSIDVNGHVSLTYKKLERLPLTFRNVSGIFNCNYNKLITLEGSPITVGDNFHCRYNKLISLDGAPKSIGGDLHCDNNPIHKIWMLFEDYSKIELFNDYDIIRGNNLNCTVILDRLNSFLSDIGKDEVKEVKGYETI